MYKNLKIKPPFFEIGPTTHIKLLADNTERILLFNLRRAWDELNGN